MASIVANLPPPLFVNGRQPLLRTLHKFSVFPLGERQRHAAVVAKAMGESSDSSTSLMSIVKFVQNIWDKPEGGFVLIVLAIALGLAATVVLWASANLITVIDKFPNLFEFIERFFGKLNNQFAQWDKPEDRFALIGLGFSAIVALWASANPITVIDKLPLIANVFELIGILFSSWFIFHHLLSKSDREELFQSVNKLISDILGQ